VTVTRPSHSCVTSGVFHRLRFIHPYATKQYRQPADPGNKTDDTDLFAMHRAAVNGFGVLEHDPDPIHVQLQLLARHRRCLVEKNVVLRQQMLEQIHSYMPLYSKCFDVSLIAKPQSGSPKTSAQPRRLSKPASTAWPND
jgi:transposase